MQSLDTGHRSQIWNAECHQKYMGWQRRHSVYTSKRRHSGGVLGLCRSSMTPYTKLCLLQTFVFGISPLNISRNHTLSEITSAQEWSDFRILSQFLLTLSIPPTCRRNYILVTSKLHLMYRVAQKSKPLPNYQNMLPVFNCNKAWD